MPMLNAFDHLLLGVSDLDHGIDWLEQRTSVRAAIGGVHPGQGTRNALVSLGEAHYLEVIAPDPAQTEGEWRALLSELDEPRLFNLAVKTSDVKNTAAALRRSGVHAVGPRDGSRRTASGALLRWRVLDVESPFQSDGVDPIPFFIEWATDSIHPSKNAPAGCLIEDLSFEHPRADELRTTLRAMGLEANIRTADRARIVAIIRTPKGRVELA
jgi:Glyoxalase-like domain